MSRSVVPVIRLSQVRKVFAAADGKSMVAVEDTNLTIGRHKFVAIIGPSGCGKSTILRLVGGLLPATAGTIEIYGAPVTEPRDEIGFVFQRPTLLPWLNVFDNVVFPMRHKFGRVTAAERERARELLALVELSDFATHLPDALSGGMQQRVAIARALLHDPEILLMDEPFSALDALTREEMSFGLQRIWIERPKTVIFVTHSIPEALLLSDTVVVMTPRPGRIREIIEVPLARPRTLQTLSDPSFAELANQIRERVFTRRVG